MEIRVLSAADVRAALPMRDAIKVMRSAFGQVSAGEAVMPLRSGVETPAGVTLVMPAYLSRSGELGMKIASIYPDNPGRGLPMISAIVIALDPATGRPTAVMDGGYLTGLRTGAGGGLAADLLARGEASTVAVFGAGVQARAQLEAVMAVRTVTRVQVISRTQGSAEKFATEIREWAGSPEVVLAPTPAEAIASADIVITATTSTTPVFSGKDLGGGAHITAVGSFTPEMQEVDELTVSRAAKIVVDSREAALAEAGDLIIAGAEITCELGDIVNGDSPGRESDNEITLFKSVGMAAQDAAAAAAVVARAEAEGIGTLIEV